MTQSLTYVEIDIPTFAQNSPPEPFSTLLLHFDGADASTTITDSSLAHHPYTAVGNAQLDTSQFKFGTSSLLLDGTGDYLAGDGSRSFAFGFNDFTIDFWVRLNSTGTTKILYDSRSGEPQVAIMIYINTSNQMRLWVSGADRISGATALTTGAWFHVALTRSGTSTRLFLNGLQQGSTYSDSNEYQNGMGVSAPYIGASAIAAANYHNGWLDEYRVINGTALWTANFDTSLPTSAYEDPIETFRFTTDVSYLPSSIAAIPSIKDVKITPSIVSIGGDLGQRASVTVTLKDHRHIFNGEAFDSGTFWGKFRARYGIKLRGYLLRVIRGVVGDTLDGMETRNYIIDSTDGPTTSGEYRIVAKDVLKLADGDRAQAPRLSNGFLVADITSVAASLTLSPSGIGNAEYPASGRAAIGGKEIIEYTRSGDVVTITSRALLNTVAAAHTAGDRVQRGISITSLDVADIIYDLLVNYAGVNSSYIPLSDWQAETSNYLNTVYSAFIAEPTSVNKLIAELIEQAGLVIWWDDIGQQIRLQVLRAVSSSADTFDEDNILANSLDVKEQPDKRVSQVYTYFAKINPLVSDDEPDNYRSTAFATDATVEAEYGSPAIKKIFSRWIPVGGRAVADTLNDLVLGRFINPPRLLSFDVLRYSISMPSLGAGYQIGGWLFQDMTGASELVPAQITRLNPQADVLEIEAEEILFTDVGGVAPTSPDLHTIIIDSNLFNVNLRTMHDNLYATAVVGITVQCLILSNILIGSSSTSAPAFEVGSWDVGITINIVMSSGSRIQGAAGNGGIGGPSGGVGSNGGPGGVALFTRKAINLTSTNGAIWGGGGGGGGGGSSIAAGGGGAGGGGGNIAGTAGYGGAGDQASNGVSGDNGSLAFGGAGGSGGSGDGLPAGNGGYGGNPGIGGFSGTAGTGTGSTAGGTGGSAGAAIDGDSFVTDIGTVGSIIGGQIN